MGSSLMVLPVGIEEIHFFKSSSISPESVLVVCPISLRRLSLFSSFSARYFAIFIAILKIFSAQLVLRKARMNGVRYSGFTTGISSLTNSGIGCSPQSCTLSAAWFPLGFGFEELLEDSASTSISFFVSSFRPVLSLGIFSSLTSLASFLASVSTFSGCTNSFLCFSRLNSISSKNCVRNSMCFALQENGEAEYRANNCSNQVPFLV
mmetsp:Transcript_27930/g.67868  ORF Transcript_27930/g.67868 Transcript_27930/m.67868 type:complete len:207 (-) Transcript_27930:8939-9559(-)